MAVSVGRSNVVRFGIFEVDRRARELRRQGRRVRLQEQPFQVLALLLEHAGEVVTRDELRQQLWPSSVYVDFDHGLNNAIARLRDALGDAAATPHYIETLPRLGYRFIYPLSDAIEDAPAPQPTERALPQSSTTTNTLPPGEIEMRSPGTSHSFAPRLVWAAAILAAVVVLGLGLWFKQQGVAEPAAKVSLAKAPSIAVLPFVNLSSDVESEYFADGLSEEIVIKLAGIRGLKVVGRTSSFYFKGKQESLPTIARTLNVNHVLEGSVRRSGARVRITAQLIDASGGGHLWSQTFDRDLSDIFQIQEDIAVAVATALSVKLVDADAQRLRKRGTQDAEAYRLYLIANTHFKGISVKRDLVTAKRLFEQALARDPQFAAAHAALARYYFHHAWTLLDDVEDGARLGQAAAERAVALDPESSDAVQARANFAMWRYRFLGDYQAYGLARTDYRRAAQLDPSNDAALFDYGRAVLWHEPDLAQTLFERVAQLEPLANAAQGMSATALSHRGLHEAARTRLREADDWISDPQRRGWSAVFWGSLELYLGHLDEAVIRTREALTRGGLELPVWLWGLHMSLGEREAARDALDFGDTTLAGALSDAARLMMNDRYDEAFESLDRHRTQFERSRVLDLPTARLALITGKPERALAIMAQRLPDLFAGVEPVNGQNVIPSLDLVAAWVATNEHTQSRQLLDRITTFLDGPAAPQLSLFIYQRARAHALNGEPELALQALDRAYAAGFRTTWALDLHPQPLLYIDPIEVDPAFATLKSTPRYIIWLARINEDNTQQLVQLRARDAAQPAT